jgi:hypothetical protein
MRFVYSSISKQAFVAVAAIVLTSGCQPNDTGGANITAPSLASMNDGPPTITELENATYLVEGQSVTLTDGEWQGKPFDAGGASRPRIGLVRGLHLTGNLNDPPNGDTEKAVVLLWSNSGGSGTFDYLAVMGRDSSGVPLNLATAALGDRVMLRDAKIEDDRIIIDVVQTGLEDARCCPGQKVRREFALEGDGLTEAPVEDMGRLSIADLAGVEWRLTRFDRDAPVPNGIEVTLFFDEDSDSNGDDDRNDNRNDNRNRINGGSGCNRYSGSVSQGRLPGELTTDMPMISTMMACPPPADEVERRYLDALQHVTQFSFVAGQLALTWRKDDQIGTMIFVTATSISDH